jgi:uncharacterized protein YjiS (DUF1127 family)
MQISPSCTAAIPFCGAARLTLYLIAIQRQTMKGAKMLWSVIRFLHAWKRYGSAVQELSSLNDRELADIGITRSDIPRLAWEHAKA